MSPKGVFYILAPQRFFKYSLHMTSLQRRALLATIIGSGMVFLDGSVVNLALPKIATGLHTGFSELQWVIDGYLLTLSALILLGGSLSDIYGRKRIYFWGVIGFGVASFGAAVTPSIGWLIAARLLQGIFGALMVPGALAIINTNFAAELRGKAIGLWTAWTSAILATGPLIGGTLIDRGSWRLIFLINLPLLLLTCWLGLPSIKESRSTTPRSVDIRGALLAVIALGGVTYGLIQGTAAHWSWASIVALLIGAASVTFFVRAESRSPDPMLQLELFKSRNFSGANLATFAMYGALGGFFFAFNIFLQTNLHYSSLAAGLTGAPVSICLILFSSRVGALSSKFGPRFFMTFGPALSGIGILTLLGLHPGSSYTRAMLPGIALFGIGMSLTVAPLTTTVLESVRMRETGIASAVNNAVSRVSGLIIIALLGLFGATHAYQFAVLLCGGLALGAGLLSFMWIRNERQPRLRRSGPNM